MNPLEDVVASLPCENPTYDSRGVAVFGKSRSVSTSVNRVEFPATCSTLEKPVRTPVTTQVPTMVWDEGSYTGYKLNCHKKKRKVDSLIELYDKDSVNSVQDKEIYRQKLEEISNAALAAVEYISDLLAELEANEEEERIAELKAIKKKVIESVKFATLIPTSSSIVALCIATSNTTLNALREN